jgi:hypothetical protein
MIPSRNLNSSAAPRLRQLDEFSDASGRKVSDLTISIIGIAMMPATGAKSALGS